MSLDHMYPQIPSPATTLTCTTCPSLVHNKNKYLESCPHHTGSVTTFKALSVVLLKSVSDTSLGVGLPDSAYSLGGSPNSSNSEAHSNQEAACLSPVNSNCGSFPISLPLLSISLYIYNIYISICSASSFQIPETVSFRDHSLSTLVPFFPSWPLF